VMSAISSEERVPRTGVPHPSPQPACLTTTRSSPPATKKDESPCISLPHDKLAVGQTEHGERAQHRLKRLGAISDRKGQRMILLLVAHENREIERGLVRLFDDMKSRTGVDDVPDFQHGRRNRLAPAVPQNAQAVANRAWYLTKRGLDVVHRPA